MKRIGLAVHPRREIAGALAPLQRWCAERGAELVQVPGQSRRVATEGDPAACDLLVALGGDGTTLAALRHGAVAQRLVLGIACGSLGALTAVSAASLTAALDRVAAGDWRGAEVARADRRVGRRAGSRRRQRRRRGAPRGGPGRGEHRRRRRPVHPLRRRRAGRGHRARLQRLQPRGGRTGAGAGRRRVRRYLLAPHGGCCPPLVVEPWSRLTIAFEPGFGGARIELDGQILDRLAPLHARELTISRRPDHATLVMLGGEETALAGLRRRRVLLDSPRMLARDDRAAVSVDQIPDSRV